MTTSTIAKELELPRSSVFKIMKTLKVEGKVHSISKGYVMGHSLINHASPKLAPFFSTVCQPIKKPS